MRIISGVAKGLKLSSPSASSQLIRPTSDRSREALFNIIHSRIQGALVLDLFAGTGALGLEAMSRGAHAVTFVDISPVAMKLIKKNIKNFLKSYPTQDNSSTETTNLEARGNIKPFVVIKKDIRRGVHFLVTKANFTPNEYDIIFLDPPYSKGICKQTLFHLDKHVFLTHHGLLIAEENSKEKLPELLDNLKLIDRRQYGDTAFWLYEQK